MVGNPGPSQTPRQWTRAAVIALCAGLCLLFSATALAAITVDTPPGWAADKAAQTEAQNRAQAWSTAAGYRLVSVASTTTEDDFAETLAVFEIAEPLPGAALQDTDGARDVLMRAAGPVVDSREPPLDFTIDDTVVPGAPILRGKWEIDGVSYSCALAPSGPTQSLVVLAVRTQEEALHRAAIASAVDSMQGVTAPVAPFPRGDWRLGALVVWLLVAGGSFGVVAATADRAGDHGHNAKRTSVVLFILAVAAGVGTFTLLGGEGTALQLANVSREWMTVEIAAPGAALAGVMWLVARGLSAGEVVQSAPTGGVYAGRGGAPAIPRVPDSALPRASEPPSVPEALDLPADVGDAQLEGHDHGQGQASLEAASIYEDVDEDMKTRVAAVGHASGPATDRRRDGPPPPRPPVGAPRGGVEERTPVPRGSFRDGKYSITKDD